MEGLDDIDWEEAGGDVTKVNDDEDHDISFDVNLTSTTTTTTTSSSTTPIGSLEYSFNEEQEEENDEELDMNEILFGNNGKDEKSKNNSTKTVNVELTKPVKKKRVSNQPKYTKYQKKQILSLHQSVLVCHLLNAKHVLRTLNDDLLNSIILSIIPTNILSINGDDMLSMERRKPMVKFMDKLDSLIIWFNRYFKFTFNNNNISSSNNENNNNNQKKGNDNIIDVDDIQLDQKKPKRVNNNISLLQDLLDQIQSKQLSNYNIYQIFYLICKIVGFKCRIITWFNPPPPSPLTPTKQKRIDIGIKRSSSAPTIIMSSLTESDSKSPKKSTPTKKTTPTKTIKKKGNSKKRKMDSDSESESSEDNSSMDTSDDTKDEERPKQLTKRQQSLLKSKSLGTIDDKKTKKKSPQKKNNNSKDKNKQQIDSDSEDEEIKEPSLKRVKNKKEVETVKVEPEIKYDKQYWIEIINQDTNKWVTIDIFNPKSIIMDTDRLEPIDNPYSYVLGFNHCQFKDLTSKYTNNFIVSNLKRLPSGNEIEWWYNLLDHLTKEFVKEEQVVGVKQTYDVPNQIEDFEIRQRESKSPFPISQSAFKQHPIFILEKDIPKYSSLEPGTQPLGKFKEENIYHRSCVKVLHIADKWIQKGRQIALGEQPVKVVKGKQQGTCSLYGEWQTIPYEPPTIEKDGIVPTNSFGNVYMFNPEMTPINGVHLKQKGLQRVARKLNISVGPALVGWENYCARPHPIIEGVVVAKENAKILLDAWVEDSKIRETNNDKRRKLAILNKWKTMSKKLLIQKYIDEKYANDNHEINNNNVLIKDEII